MKLNNFSGGLSTRLDSTLLEINEAVKYVNVDNSKGILTSIKNYTALSDPVDRWFYKFKDAYYSSFVPREYIEYKQKLYFTEQDNRAKKIVNGVLKDLGIAAPTVKPTLAENGTGVIQATTVQYMYTYFDSIEGIESAPSPLSSELTIVDNRSVDVTNFFASANTSVDKIRLYRTGAGSTDFTLVVELPVATTSYNDNILALNLIGTILDTYNNREPITGLRFLVEAYGILFAAFESTLYYTETGKPDAWKATNVISLPDTITGLSPIPDGLLIFTNATAHLLVGGKPANFRLTLVSPEHGCINHSGIKVVKNQLLWPSVDGICSLQGSTIEVLTKNKLGNIKLDSINAVVYSEQYMLTLADGSVLVLDFRFGVFAVKYIQYVEKRILSLGVFDNILYGIIDSRLALIDNEGEVDFYYTSPNLTEGDASVNKLYNNIYIRANGSFTIYIYIDEKHVTTESLEGDKIFDLKIPALKQRGSAIQFKIQGRGKIKEIEYKVLGRENGR